MSIIGDDHTPLSSFSKIAKINRNLLRSPYLYCARQITNNNNMVSGNVCYTDYK